MHFSEHVGFKRIKKKGRRGKKVRVGVGGGHFS